MPYTAPAIHRFVKFLEVERSGCWNWTGGLARGYGRFWSGERYVSAHRWSYEMFVSKIPDRLVIDHLCRNTRCVRPDHLEAVTNWENVQRAPGNPIALNPTKTHCPLGHVYDAENTYLKGGRRVCRTCNRDASRLRWRRNNPGRPTRKSKYDND